MPTENNGSSPFTMPVQPMYGNGNGNNGFGFGGDGLWFLILFFLLCGNGGWGGFGGWGMGGIGAMNAGMDYLYPWLNNSQHISDGFRDQQISTNLNGIQNAITSGFGDVQLGIAGINQNLCQTGNGIINAVNGGFNAAESANNARQIANMQQAFAAQTAMGQGFNGLQSQLASCCCENRLAAADNKFTIATESCATRTANAENTTALLNAFNSGVQSIKDQLCADKIEQKNDVIAQLRSELMYARGQASQDVQTAAIQAGQRALANEVEQYVAPRPIPSYTVQNPNCCYNMACGCGAM